MFNRNKIGDGELCPLLNGPCVEAKCRFWMRLQGTDPQTGNPRDEFGCAIPWLVVVTLEGNKETRQAAAAMESTRNEMVRCGEGIKDVLVGIEQSKAVHGMVQGAIQQRRITGGQD